MNSFITLACLWAATAEPAKDAPLDTQFLRDYAETRGFMLGRPTQAKPTPDGKAVLFLRSEARKPKLSLYEFDVATGKTRELLTPATLLKGAEETLSPEEKARRERMRVSLSGFTSYQLSDDGSLILLSLSGKLYVYDRSSGKVRELKTGPGVLLDPKFSPDGKQVAYVRDHDVHVYDLSADQERRLTTGGTEKKPHGLAEFVAQEEMGRFSGYWWSPDSKFIAYEEYDADGVEVWYVADPVHPDQAPLPSYYPRPGKKNVSVRLGVIAVGGGATAWVDWDHKAFEYLASVRWDKPGPLTVIVQNRLQNQLKVLAVTPTDGHSKELFDVALYKDARPWISLQNVVVRWLDTDRVLYRRENGAEFLESKNAPRMRRIDTFEWFQRVIHLDSETGELLFEASWNPTETHVFRVNVRSGKYEDITLDEWHRLTPKRGIHTAAGNNKLICVASTSLIRMPTTSLIRPTGERIGELPSVAESPGFLPEIELEPRVPPIPTISGASFRVDNPIHDNEIIGAIIRPRKFDSDKKYPVIVNVYGGPGHNQVVQAMRNWLLPQWLADQGFIVVAIDNRGTPGRGPEWEKAIYGRFGSVPLEDQVRGVLTLCKKHKEMDVFRVGIYGWSFGGYMSALAVLKRPDVFKAAVAGAPVTDWEDYDTHYTERYLGLPQDNPQVYKDASLLTYSDRLERPLLIVHGTADDNVYFRHSLRLADALFRAGKDFEMLPLSGLTHQVPDPVVMQRLYSRIVGHFQKHLGQPK